MSSSESDLPTVFDPETCIRKGLCAVTELRPQGLEALESHSLYYEMHGSTEPTAHKVLLVMGLNGSCFAWGPQVSYFTKKGGYTVLVFDNRGVGYSGYPRGPYTTSGMAEDAIFLLDYLGWTKKRDLHVVGGSLGGMISLELATRVPERIASLVLGVTTPGGRVWNNFPPWKGIISLARLIIAEEKAKLPIALDMMFPSKWLDEIAEDDPQGRTNREVQGEEFSVRLGITRPQRFLGQISQMAAALTHYVSPDRLRSISLSIPKVTIVTGDEDNLVNPQRSRDLKASMPEAELVEWQGTGHGIHVQGLRRFGELVERTIREGVARLNGDNTK